MWRLVKDVWPWYSVTSRSRWNAQELLQFQRSSLHHALRYAARTTLFHRERAPAYPERLSDWPLTSREDLQSAPIERLLAPTVDPRSAIRMHTSGSTGEPLTIYYSESDFRLRYMYFMRMFRAYGIPYSRPIAQVGCYSSSRLSASPIDRRAFLSIRDPVDHRLESCARAKPVVIFGFTTDLAEMAVRAQERGLEIPSLRIAIGVGECMDDAKHSAISNGFRAIVRDSYGAVEAGNIGFECPSGGGCLHVHWDNLAIEILNNGEPAPYGHQGEVAITHLHYRAMPLVRYRLGDLASLLPECPCGHRLPVIQRIYGRQDDVITLRSGLRITPLRINGVLCGQSGIRRYRLVQARPGVFSLDIDGTDDGMKAAAGRLRTVLESDDVLTVRRTTIPRPPGAKERTILVEAR
jgi:phenylacetate-CoA ligase